MAEVSERVRRRVRLDYPDRAEPDSRDLLVGAGLGDEGWEGLLEAELGPASPPPPG
ncbi:hypothetical protein [Streptomyces sp. NPDC127072]|uniref:hypothetical protein n=1 Tax=Streptomyces sp. NPDC127072 TaxID=3347129 RepID=UPI0036556EA5